MIRAGIGVGPGGGGCSEFNLLNYFEIFWISLSVSLVIVTSKTNDDEQH